MSELERKRQIALTPRDLGLPPDAGEERAAGEELRRTQPGDDAEAQRRTQPTRSLDRQVLQVLDGMGVDVGGSSESLRPGGRIAHYELIRELGRGAMGRVYLARDTKLGRRVAIKFLQAGHFGDRFLVEARTTARCSHENIVVIHDVSEHQGQPYMVLEYLQGQPLSKLMAGRSLSPQRAVELIVPVVRAMVCAHEFGIVHRDLKPENIFVTESGAIKVLDFGIAKLRALPGEDGAAAGPAQPGDTLQTQDGMLLGTMPYMSPEQWRVRDDPGGVEVDHRSDIWAVGIILYELVCGRHPLDPLSRERLATIADLDEPMPPVDAGVPGALARIIQACLKKRKSDRLGSARELLDRLEPLLDGGRRLGHNESPYAGLTPFQEQDAHRFFGRSRDIARLTGRLRNQPLVGVVGPTGVGKSSFVRAGVVPALKRSGEPWEIFVMRPGRHPLAALANLVESLPESGFGASIPRIPVQGSTSLEARLADEPGYLGLLLRSRARAQNTRILIFVDQFEELYTLVPDPRDRLAFTACLAGVADDASTPLRVIVSMRSDFLDRAAEDRDFMDQLTGALMFLAPPSRRGLEAALVQPAEMAGYSFEDADMVERILGDVDTSAAPLPLLQFTAARLWDARDRDRRLLTRKSYEDLGGIAGALASHADEVLASLPAQSQGQVRTLFERLVTPERTRAIASVDDLCQLSREPEHTRELIDRLVRARLLVVHSDSRDEADSDGPTVEIVHESLIDGWPTLRRWLDEDDDRAAFLAQLRVAAKQWDARGRTPGLLWRGEAMAEARHWYPRLRDDLSGRERAYLDAVIWLSERSARRRRWIIAGAFGALVAMVAATMVALLWIRDAEQAAVEQAWRAQLKALHARYAENLSREKAGELARANREVQEHEGTLERINERLRQALREAKEAREQAERQFALAQRAAREAQRASEEARESAEAEAQLRRELEALLEEKKELLKEKQERVEKLERELGVYTKRLK